jgi:hypothetical protein
LTLQDLNLTPQRENLSLKAGLVDPARRDRVEDHPKKGVQQSGDHGDGSYLLPAQSRSAIRAFPA